MFGSIDDRSRRVKVIKIHNSWLQIMAFALPANNAGLPIPEIPANPPSLSDIANTRDYVERLILPKGKCFLLVNETNWSGFKFSNLLWNSCHRRRDWQRRAVPSWNVLRTSLGGAAAPPSLDAFANTLDQIQQTVELYVLFSLRILPFHFFLELFFYDGTINLPVKVTTSATTSNASSTPSSVTFAPSLRWLARKLWRGLLRISFCTARWRSYGFKFQVH